MSRSTEAVRRDARGALAALALALLLSAPQLHPGTTVPRDILSTVLPWSLEIAGPPANWALGDALFQGYPARKLLHDAARDGEFPLWNPLILGGSSLAADPNNAVFYPPNLLLALLSPGRAFDLHVVLHLMIACLGTYALGRVWGASRAGALVAAAAFCGSSALTVWRFHANLIATAAWVPWVLAAFELAIRRRSHRAAVGAAFAVGLLVVANFAQWALYVLLLLGAYATWASAAHPDRRARGAHTLALAAAVVLLGVGLGAIQLAPLLELSELSTRSAAMPYDQLETRSQDARKLVTLLSPWFFGSTLGGATRWLPGHPVYWGVVPFVIALAAPCWRRAGRVRFLWWAFLLAVSVTWGAPTARLLALLPGLDRVAPNRAALVVCLLGSLLAGIAFDGVCRRARPARRRIFGVSALLAAAVLAGAALLLPPSDRAAATRQVAAGGLAVLAAATLLVAGPRGRSMPASARATLAALIVADVAVYSVSYSPPSVPEAGLLPMPRVLQALGPSSAPTRVAVVVGGVPAIPPNLLAALGFADPGGFSSLIPAYTARLLEQVNAREAGTAPSGSARTERVLGVERADSPLLDMAGVEYVVSTSPLSVRGLDLATAAQGLFLYRNREAAPRAFVVSAARVARSEEAERRLLGDPAFSACRYAVVAAPAPDLTNAGTPEGCVGSASIAAYRRNEVAVRTDTHAPGLLVLTEAYHPGWQVSLDGAPASLLRANGAFRAVAVPSGRHHVVFQFRPKSLGLGLALTVASVLVLAVAFSRR